MFRWPYTVLLYLLLPFALLKLLWRSVRQPDYLRHLPERFGIYRKPRPKRPVIWLHAVSVGETRAAAPLVEQLRQQYPGYDILLTHATPTGRATGEQLFGENVLRTYLPYDLPGAMARFLDHYAPRLGLLMETELWFNLIAACNARQVPLLLVNARLSERSARGYARLGGIAREGLQSLAAISAQTEADAIRLRALGASQVDISGNLKFDVTPPADAASQGAALRQRFGATRPIFLAASTREGEEALVLDAMHAAARPDMLTVIVPRHPQRFDEVAELLQRRGISFVRRSQNVPVAAGCQVVLGDSMGEMYAYYAACDIAFIGGSLLPYGGQNLIEACAMGKPALVGPHTFNFEQAAKQAVECGAARRVNDGDELVQAVSTLLGDALALRRMGEAGTRFWAENRGSTARVMALLARHLKP